MSSCHTNNRGSGGERLRGWCSSLLECRLVFVMALLPNCGLYGFLTVTKVSWSLDLLLICGRLCHLFYLVMLNFLIMLELRLQISLPDILGYLNIGLRILQEGLLVLLLDWHLLAIKCWCGGALTRMLT